MATFDVWAQVAPLIVGHELNQGAYGAALLASAARASVARGIAARHP